MKRIDIDLNSKSVREAIKQIREYQAEIEKKNEIFVKKLGNLGLPVIESSMARSRGDADPHHRAWVETEPNESGDGYTGILYLEGEEILFFEFGSGIYYNPSDPEHASKFGYGVGTYPNQTHAFDDNGWWYRDDAGIARHTYGQEATSPMLSASHEIIANIRKIAREVYGNK